jgi:hypothetical protein
MARFIFAMIAVICSGAAAADSVGERSRPSKMIIRQAGPNAPAHDPSVGDLVGGHPKIDERNFWKTRKPMQTLAKAVYGCGVRVLEWRDVGYEGEGLLLDDTPANRAAIPCISRKVPWDFYVSRKGS